LISPFPKENTRKALLESLPNIDEAGTSAAKEPAFTYVPPSHARALEPDNTLVEGIRGAGKSFWWAALNSAEHRSFIASAFPEARIGEGVIIFSQGYGAGQLPPTSAPSKDVLANLAQTYDPRHIWRAVVAAHIHFPSPFPERGKWREKVQWVKDNPEDYDELLYAADQSLFDQRKSHLILFDALDRLADDWSSIRPLARSLFQVALDLRSCRSIRLKLFVRPDMLEDRDILAFPDASKLLARRVSLAWRRVDLYALLFQCMGNAANEGRIFREHCRKAFGLTWKQDQGSQAWILPRDLRGEEDMQKQIFHAIAGPAMASGASGHKRGFPYTWLPNHLLDGREQVSPRSFCAALRQAAAQHMPDEWLYPLHFKAIQSGVQEASRIRVNEITTEDYPWVNEVMLPLRGKLTVPCLVGEIFALWNEASIIDKLRHRAAQGDVVKLPPQHLDDGLKGILSDLESLGLVQSLSSERIQMPDVYRIAFGLGRRGGVKPLR